MVAGMLGRILPALLSQTAPLFRPLPALPLFYLFGGISLPLFPPSSWFCCSLYFFGPTVSALPFIPVSGPRFLMFVSALSACGLVSPIPSPSAGQSSDLRAF